MRVPNSQETCRWKKAGDRSHSRMFPMYWADSSSEKGLLLEEAFLDLPQDPTEELTMS